MEGGSYEAAKPGASHGRTWLLQLTHTVSFPFASFSFFISTSTLGSHTSVLMVTSTDFPTTYLTPVVWLAEKLTSSSSPPGQLHQLLQLRGVSEQNYSKEVLLETVLLTTQSYPCSLHYSCFWKLSSEELPFLISPLLSLYQLMSQRNRD